MAKIDELSATVEELKREIKRLRGEPEPILEMGDRPDYIPHGSDRHAAFLGLVEHSETDICLATYTSPRTGRVWRLESEMDAVRCFPGIDPEKAVKLLLQQKVGELENKPEPPPDAPRPFEPAPIYPS